MPEVPEVSCQRKLDRLTHVHCGQSYTWRSCQLSSVVRVERTRDEW